jgi:hypothetical protein
MTIAVGCNLSDGVVMGVDSAITISGKVNTPQGEQEGVLKVYNDARKLFPLFDLPIGIATYGVAQLELRTIESYVREFEHENDIDKVKDWPIEKTSIELWTFFNEKYRETFSDELEKKHNKPYDEIDPNDRPTLGLLVGGFSPGEYLSEVWDVMVHASNEQDGVKQSRAPGNFGSNWRGQVEGIRRFHKGFSFQHLDSLVGTILGHFNQNMDQELHSKIQSIIQSSEYIVPWGGMPLQEGIDYVKFCLDIMINQTKFVIGAPTCGGNVHICVVQRDEGFTLVTNPDFEVRML